ncbi:unnamed protein product [Notodromas monacha]|uniref:Rho GDP-dissociation inhibitor 3 n=1 Tax=Notodromas monacha TaxID=399045 RepID=A0A7R9BS20_9CRUS|nr:unnamed protein product [Notodromas monacha]CAG0919265.1 unnamed protein product [Notodromas monacha]
MSGADAGDHREEEHEVDVDALYKPPPEKSIDEMLQQDTNDESLKKYKEALLGKATQEKIILEPEDPRKVLVKKLALLVEGRNDMELDLSGDISKLKEQTQCIKEGVHYKIRIDFNVQREIVHGLKYVQKTYRKGIQVDKMKQMVGSYAPSLEMHSFTTPGEEAPSGMVARGHYTVKSLFTDDDNNEHLKWEWSFEIKKDWK